MNLVWSKNLLVFELDLAVLLDVLVEHLGANEESHEGFVRRVCIADHLLLQRFDLLKAERRPEKGLGQAALYDILVNLLAQDAAYLDRLAAHLRRGQIHPVLVCHVHTVQILLVLRLSVRVTAAVVGVAHGAKVTEIGTSIGARGGGTTPSPWHKLICVRSRRTGRRAASIGIGHSQKARFLGAAQIHHLVLIFSDAVLQAGPEWSNTLP